MNRLSKRLIEPAYDPLYAYRSKRNFALTPEPAEGAQKGAPPLCGQLRFTVQKRWASSLHYDFRLELEGTMKSWAVPKGPSFDPSVKRMALQVEDHPLAYADFEGTIPPKQYGAGKVIVWDSGTWLPLQDPQHGIRDGNLKFELHGHKLHGRWVLVRMKGKGEKQPAWLLIKDAWSARARPGLGIAVPVTWAELPSLRGGDHWSVKTVHQRLDTGNQPWLGYTRAARGLATGMSALGYAPPAP